jgi:hypothetical protein
VAVVARLLLIGLPVHHPNTDAGDKDKEADAVLWDKKNKTRSKIAGAELLGTPYTKWYLLPSIPFNREQPLHKSHSQVRSLT